MVIFDRKSKMIFHFINLTKYLFYDPHSIEFGTSLRTEVVTILKPFLRIGEIWSLWSKYITPSIV